MGPLQSPQIIMINVVAGDGITESTYVISVSRTLPPNPPPPAPLPPPRPFPPPPPPPSPSPPLPPPSPPSPPEPPGPPPANDASLLNFTLINPFFDPPQVELSPLFAPFVRFYSATVSSVTTTVGVLAIPRNTRASVRVVNPAPLEFGSNVVQIVVRFIFTVNFILRHRPLKRHPVNDPVA